MVQSWIQSHLQWQVFLHTYQIEWKGHHEGYTIPMNKLVHVKFDPAKETNDGVHDSWRIFFRERLQVQVKKNIGGLSQRILLEPHSIWTGKTNHKKLFYFLARPIIWLGTQTFIEKTINHNWAPLATAKRPHINTGKVYPIIARSRRPVTTIHAVRRNQSCLPQDSGSNKNNLHGPNSKVPSYI